MIFDKIIVMKKEILKNLLLIGYISLPILSISCAHSKDNDKKENQEKENSKNKTEETKLNKDIETKKEDRSKEPKTESKELINKDKQTKKEVDPQSKSDLEEKNTSSEIQTQIKIEKEKQKNQTKDKNLEIKKHENNGQNQQTFINKEKQKTLEDNKKKEPTKNLESEKNKEQVNQPIVQETADLTIAHWNILNYGGISATKKANLDKQKFKIDIIAQIISKINPDVVGLTEINYQKGQEVKLIVDKLNQIDKKQKRFYQYIYQPDEQTNPESSNSTKESIAIIYDSNKVEPISFNNLKIGSSFNGELEERPNNKKTKYVRPPFGVMFKKKGEEIYFTTIFAHFDSPGIKRTKNPEKDPETRADASIWFKDIPKSANSRTTGYQEAAEAYYLYKVFEHFKNIGGKNFVFGGDTNIKQNVGKIFDTSVQRGFLLGWDESNKAKTSLKSATNILRDFQENNSNQEKEEQNAYYSQTYDKMLYQDSAFNQLNSNKWTYKFDLFHQLKYDNKFSAYLIDKWKEISGSNYSLYQLIPLLRKSVSDHLPVYLKLNFKKEKEEN
ncbi:MnuA family membrane nuclease [Mycoplasmopsis sturni]|uniref:MnuA family membrane nuclease n=1 Tax=Mycoplasmopsis sturni TaxID=39047 RepID=UPI000567A4D8|nr:endonuclease/exonuclease/phosphatase family protein [Mycoplasmopsis sturni]